MYMVRMVIIPAMDELAVVSIDLLTAYTAIPARKNRVQSVRINRFERFISKEELRLVVRLKVRRFAQVGNRMERCAASQVLLQTLR